MATKNICSASPTHQDECCYNSHVRLLPRQQSRGMVFGLKPNSERTVYRQEWQEDDGAYFLLTKRVRGQPLSEAWPIMSWEDKECVAKQTAEYLMQLCQLRSNQMESVSGQPIYSAFLFLNGYGIGHGPFSSDDELWAEMSLSLAQVPEQVRSKSRQRMPSAAPYTFTHGDLTNVNIIIENGNLTGILDWESSGYFPVWWEFTCAGIGLGQEDKEWKELLCKHMPDHTEARNFWLDFFALRKYPKLGERGPRFLKESGLNMPEKEA